MKLTKNHIRLFGNALVGISKKIWYRVGGIPSLNKNYSKSRPELIVSLTSYGRRVSETVYYTLISLLKQTYLPDRIILWLDSDNWSEHNLPKNLRKLIDKGIEIRFCEDIKSYKKLIPTLRENPESIIITVDDDVIYSSRLLEVLYSAHLKFPSTILCTRAYKAKFVGNKPAKYKTWKNIIGNSNLAKDEILFPVGIGGILYPPHSLYKDILKENIFMKLCPTADDIWFWYMAKLNGTKHQFVEMKNNFYSFDAIYQALHKGSALTHSNVTEDHNDVQLEKVLETYGFKNI